MSGMSPSQDDRCTECIDYNDHGYNSSQSTSGLAEGMTAKEKSVYKRLVIIANGECNQHSDILYESVKYILEYDKVQDAR